MTERVPCPVCGQVPPPTKIIFNVAGSRWRAQAAVDEAGLSAAQYIAYWELYNMTVFLLDESPEDLAKLDAWAKRQIDSGAEEGVRPAGMLLEYQAPGVARRAFKKGPE